MSDICNSAASLTILDAVMDTGTVNGPLPPERAGDEELPLIPLSPVLDRSERLKALSKLSLQSLASVFDDHDVTDAGDDDVQVGMATVFDQRFHLFAGFISCTHTELGFHI